MTAIAAAEKKKIKDEMYYKFNTGRGMGYWKSRMKNYDDGEFTSKLTLFTYQILVLSTRFDQGLVLLYHSILIICLFIGTTILVLWVLESLCKTSIFIIPEKWTPLGTVQVFVKLVWFCARLLGVQGHRPVRRLAHAHLCRNKCSPNTFCTASKPQLRVAVGNLCLCVTRKCIVTLFFHLHEVLSSCCSYYSWLTASLHQD